MHLPSISIPSARDYIAVGLVSLLVSPVFLLVGKYFHAGALGIVAVSMLCLGVRRGRAEKVARAGVSTD